LFIVIVFYANCYNSYLIDFGRKITKNICFIARKQVNTHFFSKKNSFFSIFCLFFAKIPLYLRQNFEINIKHSLLKQQNYEQDRID